MDTTEIAYRWQFCRGADDITADYYAQSDADMVRAWEGAHGDFCLLEVTRGEDGLWRATGGDGDWTRIEGSTYGKPVDALTDLLGGNLRKATCWCGTDEACED
jgi:hypothetical protein